MRIAPVLVVVSALAATGAWAAADAGHCELPDGGTETLAGDCDDEDGGSQAVFCTDSDPTQGTLARLPCSDFPGSGGATLHGRCEVIDPIGAWCTFPEHSQCALDNGAVFACGFPSDVFSFVCDKTSGCSQAPSTSALFGDECFSNAPKCFGNFLRVDCTSWDEGVTVDCAAEHGVCDTTNTVCVDGVGGQCDGLQFTCASGLTCVSNRCIDPQHPGGEGEGEGEGEGDVGEGEGEGDAGEGEGDAAEGEGDAAEGEGDGQPDPDPGVVLDPTKGSGDDVNEQPLEATGCGCRSSSPSPALALVIACVALAFVRRRS